VLLVLAIAVVILGGVVLAAVGRAGAMVLFPSDSAPMELRDLSAAEIAMLRPPLSLWGYNAQLTDEVLQQIAQAVSARDVEIATLRRQLEELRAGERVAEQDVRGVFGHHEGQVPGAQHGSS
jgi:predicted SPOUT superfamily RNA methylase MTH1